jgi:4'-phosphopantetheinyl transferase EntD
MLDELWLDCPHGACVALRATEHAPLAALEARLPEGERALARELAPRRRRGFVLGRAALHAAIARLGVDAGAIAHTPRGAPALPAGVAGSLSHKDGVAVALAALEPRAALGVDVEWDEPPRNDIRRHVLRPDDGVPLDAPWAEAARETVLRFSAKEAIYKALDRFVGRHVTFKEARVVPRHDGSALAELHLARDGEGPFAVDVRWMRRDGLVITSARIALGGA